MNYSVNLSSGQTVEVVIGEAAQINVEQALNYIESGRVEITKYVNEWAKPEITNYTNEYAKPIVTEIVNQTTKPLIDDYLNTTTKPQIDEYVADNVKPYSDSAQDSAAKAKISEDNAKTSETNAKASELAAASSAGVASAAAVTATEAKDYTAKVLTDENLKTVGQDLQSADSNIKTVATNILNVNTVAKNIDNVNLLAPHTEAMEALAPDIMDVVTVAGITEQTKNVSDNMTAVVDVSNNKTNINNVSVNMPAVTDVSENMADVKNAVQSANDAKLWAIGTKTEKPEGSSKYWAEEAKNAVQTPDASETVKGIVRLATSDEVTAGTNDSAAITPLKLKQTIAQDLTNPSANTIPSTKAVKDESSRLESIMSNKIGEITSFVCSSTYIPRGCLPCDGGEYSKEQFKDLWNNYLVDKKLLTCTYTEYANDISNYGQCAKFAIDTTNNKFKVPTIKDGSYITQAKSDNELGKSYKESLPNITGTYTDKDGYKEQNIGTGAFRQINSSETGSYVGALKMSRTYSIMEFDASRSSSTYQANAKVQGDNVRLRFFVVVVNGEINQSVMDWSAWATSLNGKMDKDASNITSNAKSTISGWSMPSSRYIDLTLGASGTTYTAPANGYFYLVKVAGNDMGQIRFSNKTKGLVQEVLPKTSTNWIYVRMEAQKGDVFEIVYNATGDTKKFRFIYAEGENS